MRVVLLYCFLISEKNHVGVSKVGFSIIEVCREGGGKTFQASCGITCNHTVKFALNAINGELSGFQCFYFYFYSFNHCFSFGHTHFEKIL